MSDVLLWWFVALDRNLCGISMMMSSPSLRSKRIVMFKFKNAKVVVIEMR